MSKSTLNPLSFSLSKPEILVASFNTFTTQIKETIKAVCEQENPTFISAIYPLQQHFLTLEDIINVSEHLYNTLNSPERRQAETELLLLKAEFTAWFYQNQELYAIFKKVKPDNSEQARYIELQLQAFQLNGIDLPADKQARFKEIKNELNLCSLEFLNNLQDINNSWEYLTPDLNELAGLPENTLKIAQASAKSKGKDGYRFTLNASSVDPILSYSTNRELRKYFYESVISRANKQVVNGKNYDNNPSMQKTLLLRKELATLFGLDNYAQFSLLTKMAKTPEEIIVFLESVAQETIPFAQKELAKLQELAKADGIDVIQAYDIAFYENQLLTKSLSISIEELNKYFPESQVVKGLFTTLKKLYDLDFELVADAEVYHPDVKFYKVYHHGKLIAGTYQDLYVRENKSGGAWVDTARVRSLNGDELALPIVYCTCNFNAGVDGKEALFSPTEIVTLYHEMGHCLHLMFIEATMLGLCFETVPYDYIEYPSQLMEGWTEEPEVISLMSKHIDTGESLPEHLISDYYKLLSSGTALTLLGQIELSLSDMKLHIGDPTVDINQFWQEQRKHVSGKVYADLNVSRGAHSFIHIFSNTPYAAGYYAYLWAEVLSADTYALFQKNGIFDQETADAYRKYVLATGNISIDPIDNFVALHGREPDIKYLLKYRNIN